MLDGRKQIRDADLNRLHALPALERVSVRDTGATRAGVAGLKARLPGCTIVSDHE
jgi:hypothetical protein